MPRRSVSMLKNATSVNMAFNKKNLRNDRRQLILQALRFDCIVLHGRERAYCYAANLPACLNGHKIGEYKVFAIGVKWHLISLIELLSRNWTPRQQFNRIDKDGSDGGRCRIRTCDFHRVNLPALGFSMT
jgi:hypothetical protein